MVSTLSSMKLPKHIPVGNCEAGGYFNTTVLQAIEYGVGWNLYSGMRDSFCVWNSQMVVAQLWFDDFSGDDLAGWTYDFFKQTNVTSLSNHPTMYIGETGWPSVKPFVHISLI